MPRRKNQYTDLYKQPVELLQHLIRFDTTNPPGNEAECIKFIDALLKDAGFNTQRFAKTPERPNLVTTLKGRGESPPLLLYGHVDVVTTKGQDWRYPPFEARIVDDWIWGRGALDMKSGIAMMLAAILRAKKEGIQPPGDVIFAALVDEEAGGDLGAKFLVEEQPQLFKDVRYAIGEFGGFTMQIGNRTFFPIMVAEKRMCWMTATFRGDGGHGSMPVKNGAMARMGSALTRLNNQHLPVHITPATRMMFSRIATGSKGLTGLVMRLLLVPWLTDSILGLLGERARLFSPLFHNTVSPTVVKASDKVNVIPSEVTLQLDGRLLPGYKPEHMVEELHKILGDGIEYEVVRSDPGPSEPNMDLFDTLAGILQESNPQAVPIPMMMMGVTDARFFSRLGIQTYGYTPMCLPTNFSFTSIAHGANERIPTAAMDFGSNAIFKVLQRF